MADIIQIRRDSIENWTLYNPILAEGELGLVLNTNPIKIKIGNGITHWNDINDYTNIEVSTVNGNLIINGVETSIYIHPNTHDASMILQDSNHRFTTDTQITSWNNKADTSYVDTKVTSIVDDAPTTLDTLNKLAASLGDDSNFATTVTNQIATKLDSSVYTANDVLTKIKTVDGSESGLDADLLDGQHSTDFATANHTHSGVYEPANSNIQSHISNTSNPHSVTKSQVGLGNVTNDAQVKKVNSTTDNAITRWDGANGDTVQNSLVTIDDNGSVNIPTGQNYKINGTALTYTDVGAASSGHNHSGVYEPVLGFTPENSANKGQNNGYAGLDSNGKLAQNVDASKITSGTIDLARLPSGVLERLIVVADQTARYALTNTNVQNGDTVKQSDTGVMYYVVDDTNLNNSSGYQIYTAGSATTVPWSGVSSKPTTLSGYGITDGVNKIIGGTNENIVIRDSIGNIVDSGMKFNDAGITVNDILSASKIYNDFPSFASISKVDVSRSGTQNISNATWTKVQFDTVALDSKSEYNNTTYRFTAIDSGRYNVKTIIGFTYNAIGVREIKLYINGYATPAMTRIAANTSSSLTNILFLAFDADLNSGDFVEIYAYHTRGSTLSLAAGTCLLSITKIA